VSSADRLGFIYPSDVSTDYSLEKNLSVIEGPDPTQVAPPKSPQASIKIDVDPSRGPRAHAVLIHGTIENIDRPFVPLRAGPGGLDSILSEYIQIHDTQTQDTQVIPITDIDGLDVIMIPVNLSPGSYFLDLKISFMLDDSGEKVNANSIGVFFKINARGNIVADEFIITRTRDALLQLPVAVSFKNPLPFSRCARAVLGKIRSSLRNLNLNWGYYEMGK